MKKSAQKPNIIVILGPTATGKSDLAVKIARTCKGEVISADSRQVYRGMDLGSGKITPREMRNVPHHLIDVVSPRSVYNVAKFQRDAYKVIDDIIARGKTPIICGGTGFYIQSIVDGVIVPEVLPNRELRKKLTRLSVEQLQSRLKKLDPHRLAEIDVRNPVRLIRAIEIATTLGSVPKIVKRPHYNCLQIGLTLPFAELEKKIEKRLTKRMKLGMLSEAKKLRAAGMSWARMESFGLEYRFMAQFLQKKISHAEMLEQIRIKSLQFAKRQMRWFKRDTTIHWHKPTDLKEICKIWHDFLHT